MYKARIDSSCVGVYPLTTAQLTAYVRKLYSPTALDAFLTSWMGRADGAMLALTWIPALRDSIEITAVGTHITLGNVPIDIEEPIYPATNEVIEHSFGTITIAPVHNNAIDYNSTFSIALPFVGLVDVDPDMLLGYGSVTVTLRVNLTDGSGVYIISCGDMTIFTVSVMYGRSIPISVESRRDPFAVIAGMLIPVINSSSTTQSVSNNPDGSYLANSNFNALQVQLFRKDSLRDYAYAYAMSGGNIVASNAARNAYRASHGYPASRVVTLGDVTGFVRCVSVSGIGDVRHGDKIVELLKQGVYI